MDRHPLILQARTCWIGGGRVMEGWSWREFVELSGGMVGIFFYFGDSAGFWDKGALLYSSGVCCNWISSFVVAVHPQYIREGNFAAQTEE